MVVLSSKVRSTEILRTRCPLSGSESLTLPVSPLGKPFSLGHAKGWKNNKRTPAHPATFCVRPARFASARAGRRGNVLVSDFVPCPFASFTAGETAGRQQVPTSPPASENSSAAHSIGSTQSTPCSSSSAA